MLFEKQKARGRFSPIPPVTKTGGKQKGEKGKQERACFVIGMFGIPSSKPSVKI